MNKYERELTIDTEALDVEWLEQPKLFMKYSRKKAKALLRAKRTHEKLKTIRSELIMQAHSGGKKLIGCTPTGPTVDAWVRAHPDYIEAKEEQITAEFEADILDAAVFAFHQRKAALENLVILHGQQYFAGPRVPRNLTEEYAQAREKARDRAADAAARHDKKKGRRRAPK